jgi:hypothetical protein
VTSRRQARRHRGINRMIDRTPQFARAPIEPDPDDQYLDSNALAAVHYWAEFIPDPLWVYFAVEYEADSYDVVKIGQAKDPRRRIASLQCGNPRQIVAAELILATAEAEKRLHGSFRTHNVRGEWFGHGMAPAILAYAEAASAAQIEAHKTGTPVSGVPELADFMLLEFGRPAL